VDKNKIVWVFNKRMLDREKQRSRYVRVCMIVGGAPFRQPLGISADRSYVSAIVDLWSFQRSKNMNSHPNSRGEAPNGVLRMRTRNEHRQRRLEFTDRAAGTVQDKHDETKMIEAVRFCWQGRK
jgi:hypothetical protein